MPNVLFILPVNLYKQLTINNYTKIYIIEHPVYFTKYNYHKQKLIFHRATMKYYYDYIKKKYKINVQYINVFDYENFFENLTAINIFMFDPVDHDVTKDITKKCKKNNLTLNILDTQTFITPLRILEEYNNTHKKLIQYHFYIFQRKRLNIMVDKNNLPLNNKWTFDTENRKPFDKKYNNESFPKEIKNKYTIEAIKYVNKYFIKNPGKEFNWLPIDHKASENKLDDFIKNKLKNFGPYQDAVNDNIFAGYHSVLSPLINVGLLNPEMILEKVLNKLNNNTIISIEAYIRQLIGWREYCRLIYMFRLKELNGNYFNNKKKLSKKWYNYHDTYTGFVLIDKLIQKTWNYGYLHHIERLMYISNYLQLNNILPQDVFNWFQSMFLDSYAVFMYPNVYGMSLFSGGPVMMTKPYFSSATYISKMSNYKIKNNFYPKIMNYEWYEVWNSLYYAFINKHKEILKKNYGTAQQVKHWNDKTSSEKNDLLKIAKKYIKLY
ncbi:deoxyribodipyrimidine photolyase-related protein [Hokovirus HKV1]|uniref:Deoxyribodipyrimidine photolyase-related protein n=1 Tax=Hokovirus HKV1 TaxID=1977638 RepID=A0A1V0SFX1_9VIRU|nr:deoxyribodipyrimidine photolyase-related protein [Hokovirus HKV1]